MFGRVREWTVYASGVAVFLAVGFGIPLLFLEGVASVLTGVPPTHLG